MLDLMIDVDEMATDAGRHCRSRRFVTSLMPMVRHASDSGALISTLSLSSTCMVLGMVTSWDCSSTIEFLSDEDGTSPTADDFPLGVAAANIASISRMEPIREASTVPLNLVARCSLARFRFRLTLICRRELLNSATP